MSDAKKESDDANATKNRVGMVAAEKLLSKWGFSNIRRADHDGEGCDFTALKSGSQCKIELKTTQTNGVPDGYESEFGNLDSLPILTAD
ncbi:MAG: hypothetical protein KIY11_10085, partial [Thermoplasmata archaeon]|nr:hypothetical protein [Candidatus Sysuiplasma acidicola]